MLADLFERELEKFVKDAALGQHQGVVVLGRELAKKYREQQETLANVATMYCKTYYELDDAKKRLPS